MPTQRFYRLPEEKKIAIRDAAMKEFVRVPYDKASINKMIQSAQISRGSFYTYFEDKADVLSFILQDIKEQGKTFAIENLERNHGNLWLAMPGLLDYIIGYCINHNMYQLYKNIIAYPEVEMIFGNTSCMAQEKKRQLAWLEEHMDISGFRNQGEEALEDVITIAMAILADCIGNYYQRPEDIGELRETFVRRLEILKNGACKEA